MCARDTHFDALVVQLQAVLDTSHEHVRHIEPVPALLRATLHPALFVDDPSFNDTIADRLAHDVLRVFFGVQMQLHADITQADPRVRQRKPPDPCLDDVLPQAHDERVRLVRLELRRVLRERALELRK